MKIQWYEVITRRPRNGDDASDWITPWQTCSIAHTRDEAQAKTRALRKAAKDGWHFCFIEAFGQIEHFHAALREARKNEDIYEH
jgi:hypothetical protein